MPATATLEAKQTLVERLARARVETDRLFQIVKPEHLYDRPIAERHRIIFYVGHLEAFDWNLLHSQSPTLRAFDPSLDKLFAFGIDPVDGGLPSDQPRDWPNESQVAAYRDRIRTSLDEALSSGAVSDQLLNVAIEHRLMHAETLSYMLHQLPLEKKLRLAQPAVQGHGRVEPEMVHIPDGTATLGLPRGQGLFGWDNEFDAHVAGVPAFSMDRYKVTNGQFLEFVQAGGYQERGLWADADWEWKQKQSIEHPAFWRRDGANWRYVRMFEASPLALEIPVYVSHAEARAYAAWKRKRLPTEAEWHRAAYGRPSLIEREFPWGSAEPDATHGYFDMRRWDAAPVNAFPDGRSYWGVDGMLANGWEWTSTLFAPFAGFEPFPFYKGYSADFFDGKHYVLKGGSPRTEACMLRRSFRNWFQPHYQYVYAGFRCAAD